MNRSSGRNVLEYTFIATNHVSMTMAPLVSGAVRRTSGRAAAGLPFLMTVAGTSPVRRSGADAYFRCKISEIFRPRLVPLPTRQDGDVPHLIDRGVSPPAQEEPLSHVGERPALSKTGACTGRRGQRRLIGW